MKETLLFFLLATAFICKGQTPTQVVTVPGSTYVYVGSLTQVFNDAGNSQKIVIKVFGGSWFGDTDGETDFYISNRGGLTINETSSGSNVAGHLALRAYQNPNGVNTDFYIVPSSTDYNSFAVSAYTFGYAQTPQFIAVITQSTVPIGTDITSSIAITPVMITDPSGNIGIGTLNSHGDKLAVNGTIHAKQINVDLTNWADYVFDKDYILKPLSEVKTYIDQNQHLPDMPAEKEVVEKGIDVGEMNKLLTKKVEELTLYLIQKDKENKEQQRTNVSLENQVQTQNFRIDKLEKQLECLLKTTIQQKN